MSARRDPADRESAAALRVRLGRLETRYRDLIERSGYGTFRASADGQMVEANGPLAGVLGALSPNDIHGISLPTAVFVDAAEWQRATARASDGASDEWAEARWRRVDGSGVQVRLTLRATRDQSGAIDGYDGLVEDVTERERQEELKRRSERMASLGTALAGVAHELNNPLAAIMGFAQLLLKQNWSPEDHAALETINHEAIRTATIVKDLLALARKRDVERRAPVNVNEAISYVARLRKHALDDAGIVCTLELDPAPAIVEGDRAQLEQVLLNLVSNAQYALTGGEAGADRRITIRTMQDAGVLTIEVADNGPGIPADQQTLIWDPFWTTKTEGEGTGLGLSVVYGIVDSHGGSIELDPATEIGARFVIRLPLANGQPAADSLAARPLDVLVVDPGSADVLFVERFLTARGHAVVNAGSGELAVRLAQQGAFDAVLCDARITGRDGRTIAAVLRESTGCARARFVLSTTAAVEARAAAPMNGAAMIRRPYDIEELRRLIEGDG